MAAKITLEEAEKRVSFFYNNTVRVVTFESIRKNTTAECLICGNKWTSLSRNIVNGKYPCKICHPHIRKITQSFDINDMIEYMGSRGMSFLLEKPQYGVDKVDIVYPCGHIIKTSYFDIKRNFGCKQCMIENYYINRFPKEDVLQILLDNKLEFISFPNEYKDGSSKISYSCQLGHITSRMVKDFIKFPTCRQCRIELRAYNNRGEGSSTWKGGVSKIWVAARARLDPWTIASLRAANYTCCITGETNIPIDVHHITSFETIAKAAMAEFGISDENYYTSAYSKYGTEVLFRIVELHNKYGLGAVLKKSVHVLYHKLYGHGNNTPSQFEEFRQRIQSGDIIIPE